MSRHDIPGLMPTPDGGLRIAEAARAWWSAGASEWKLHVENWAAEARPAGGWGSAAHQASLEFEPQAAERAQPATTEGWIGSKETGELNENEPWSQTPTRSPTGAARGLGGMYVQLRTLIGGAKSRDGLALLEQLRDLDLTDASLSNAQLGSVCLSGAGLRGADLRGADLRGADLRGADLTSAHLISADLSDTDLRDADLRDADLRDADLRDADLTSADLRDADLTIADLTRSNLSRANLTRSNLSQTRLTKAGLTNADLRGADLTNADLRGADLRDTALIQARLVGTRLEGADLGGADLSKALIDPSFDRSKVVYDDRTTWPFEGESAAPRT